MMNRERVEILGIYFDSISRDELLECVQKCINASSKIKIGFSNPEFAVEAAKNDWLLDYLNRLDLNVADGMGVVWASRLLGRSLPERITGTDFAYDIAGVCANTGASLYLLGGRPGVADLAARQLRSRFPHLIIAGTQHGFFVEREQSSVIRCINECDTDVLMVCFGNPKQEQWISQNFEQLDVKVIFGNGGAIDFLSGSVKRAPGLMQRSGLEWLWRLSQDPSPKRVKRLFSLPKFCYYVLRAKVRKLFND